MGNHTTIPAIILNGDFDRLVENVELVTIYSLSLNVRLLLYVVLRRAS
jgi:hypothetical protein